MLYQLSYALEPHSKGSISGRTEARGTGLPGEKNDDAGRGALMDFVRWQGRVDLAVWKSYREFGRGVQ
jgi:hypothetical protein